jgi:hypothetical protein
MNTIEERIRAAARAAAGTVPPDGVPPLRLPAGRPARFRSRRPRDTWTSGPAWAPRLAPAAAALITVAIVISVLTLSRTMHEPTAGTATAAPGNLVAGPPISSYVDSGLVPPYYVAIASPGNPNFNPSYAVVQATASGRALATIVPSIPGGTIVAATAAADDRTFVLDEQHWAAPESGNQAFEARSLYLLRLDSAGHIGSLSRLPVSVPRGQLLTGLALSADGGRLAMAIQPDNKKSEPDLTEVRVYALATGVTRTWHANGTTGPSGDETRSLSWTADGRTLAFDWEGNTPGSPPGVWLLDVAARGSNLLASSRQAVSWGNPVLSAVTPPPIASRAGLATVSPTATAAAQAAARPTCQEDSVITPDGSAVACAAIAAVNTWEQRTRTGFSLRRGAVTEFIEYSTATGKPARVLGHWSFGNVGALAVDVLWSDPSGSVLIGVIPDAGDGRVGVISGNEFTPLPGQASPAADQSGVW